MTGLLIRPKQILFCPAVEDEFFASKISFRTYKDHHNEIIFLLPIVGWMTYGKVYTGLVTYGVDVLEKARLSGDIEDSEGLSMRKVDQTPPNFSRTETAFKIKI